MMTPPWVHVAEKVPPAFENLKSNLFSFEGDISGWKRLGSFWNWGQRNEATGSLQQVFQKFIVIFG